ncbi:fluoride efflux transporter CrcB [Streptomyces sp. GZWMJZ-114]|uniref:fluoride efflux transporter CrcB n=1 Tax=Streptomyces sp. GZWMJZ-114 TaxID=2494734 RepID=UPI001013A721|nr:fluoride efflux transporter CrcB [Streptomyces sp. GZWMJZ-114]
MHDDDPHDGGPHDSEPHDGGPHADAPRESDPRAAGPREAPRPASASPAPPSHDGERLLPTDMDVAARDRRASVLSLLPTVAVVALGGALGAAARYAVERAWAAPPDGFPWATFTVNVAGCAAMGIVVVLFMEVWQAPPLVRPFLATGFLGGFTTLSTYAADTERLARLDRAGIALAYYAGTLCAALAAVALTSALTRRFALARRGAPTRRAVR